MISDLRLALRSLAKTPGFTVIALLIVAIGIGGTTAMFSAVNALVLRPVALPEPDRLVAVYETNLTRNLPFFPASVPDYYDWVERAHSWTGLAALDWRSMNLTGDGEPEVVPTRAITANFLPTLGLPLALGRNFLPAEDWGGAHVAIISDGFWHRRLGAASDVLGRTLTFDGVPYTIIGVTAPGQPLPGSFDVAVPLALDPTAESRTNHYLEVYGRLKPGVTLEQAEAELRTIASRIDRENPEQERGWSARLVPYAREAVGDGVRRALYVLLAAVGLLLLLACANLSNLLLVRASARVHELAVRSALGAGRWQLIRSLIAECMAVTVAGGSLGVLVSLWASDAMHSLPLPRAGEISVDPRVLAVAVTATLLTGLVAGLAPALHALRARPLDALKGRAPRASHRSRLRDALVVVQLGISLTLLIGATLLGRSFVRLLEVDPGFTRAPTLTAAMRPTRHAATFYEQLSARIAALPSVAGVGMISGLPLTDGNTSLNVFPAGESAVPAGQSIQSDWRLVDGGYFAAMQIPLRRGRTFAGLAPDEARRSVVLSASLARLLWGDRDPIGRRLDPGGGGGLLKVIGVVGDVRSSKLGVPPRPTFYWSMHRFIYGPMHLVVRSTGDLAPLIPAVRAAIKSLDPTVPLFQVRTLDDVRADSLEQERLLLTLLGSFTGVALLLAALGTYGVIAFSVQCRAHEFGIRRAVGAQAADIHRLVLGQSLRLVLAGASLGVAGALAGDRLLAALLYRHDSTDPLSYALATGVLVLIALGAAMLPAHRASRVDPMIALRAE